MTTEFNPELREQQRIEHAAWRDVVRELDAAGISAADINAGGTHESLHNAIVRWAEELAELRRIDPEPQHGERALAERRAVYPGSAE